MCAVGPAPLAPRLRLSLSHRDTVGYSDRAAAPPRESPQQQPVAATEDPPTNAGSLPTVLVLDDDPNNGRNLADLYLRNRHAAGEISVASLTGPRAPLPVPVSRTTSSAW